MPIILKEKEGIISKQKLIEGAYISSKLKPLNFLKTLSFQKGEGHNFCTRGKDKEIRSPLV